MVSVHSVNKDESKKCLILVGGLGKTHKRNAHLLTHLRGISTKKKKHTHRLLSDSSSIRSMSYGIMPEAAYPVIQLKPSLLKCYQTLLIKD